MKTLTNPANTVEAKDYEMHSYNGVSVCSPYVSYFGLLRDSAEAPAWEAFSVAEMPAYFTNGLEKFRESLNEFADLSKPSSKETEIQLSFMLESLIHARQLILEKESEIK